MLRDKPMNRIDARARFEAADAANCGSVGESISSATDIGCLVSVSSQCTLNHEPLLRPKALSGAFYIDTSRAEKTGTFVEGTAS